VRTAGLRQSAAILREQVEEFLKQVTAFEKQRIGKTACSSYCGTERSSFEFS
jgi:hypothetical protein